MSKIAAREVAQYQAETCADYHDAMAQNTKRMYPFSLVLPPTDEHKWHVEVSERYKMYEEGLRNCKEGSRQCEDLIRRVDEFAHNVAELTRRRLFSWWST